MNGRYIFYATLIVVMTLLGLFLIWRLTEIVIVLLGAIIFASAIRPIVNGLTRFRIPAGIAILLIYLTVIGSLIGLLAFAVPPLFAVGQNLLNDSGLIYRTAALIFSWGRQLGYPEFAAEAYFAVPRQWFLIQEQVQETAAQQGPEYLKTTGVVLGQMGLGLVMAFYWLTARDRIQGLMLSMTSVRHRDRLETIFNDVERTMGDYVRGTGVLMLAIGFSAFIGLLVLRVPNALALALLAGLFEALPMVGATLGALPAVLVAFTVSPLTGVATILLFVIIQLLENNVLVPRVMEKSVGLNPLLVIIAIVAGGTLNGIVGALFAIPLAAALQVIARHLLVDPMIEEAKELHMEQGVPVFDLNEDQPSPESPDSEQSNQIIIAS